MQTVRILQAVVLMLIVAMAASCASGKEYTNRLFTKRVTPIKDSQNSTIRILETDTVEINKQSWVNTNTIKGRDTIIVATDQEILVKTVSKKSDTSGNKELPTPQKTVTVTRNSNSSEVRNKRSRDYQ